MKQSARSFQLLQLGVCTFQWDEAKNEMVACPFAFYGTVAPDSATIAVIQFANTGPHWCACISDSVSQKPEGQMHQRANVLFRVSCLIRFRFQQGHVRGYADKRRFTFGTVTEEYPLQE